MPLKKLDDILFNVPVKKIEGSTDLEISSICLDSRAVRQGSVFVAIKGTQSDGHLYIGSSILSGAKAVLCEDLPVEKPKGVTYLVTEDPSAALGILAANFYDHPSEKLKLIGVTGTNGKTTIVTLLYDLMIRLGYKAGLLSTAGNKINGQPFAATHTTPDAVTLQSLLKQMVEDGCEYCFMEVSSHAVVQKRISGLHFSGGVFTNITHDHLDYHHTFSEYIKAKKGFFDCLPSGAFVLVNADDKNGMVMVQNTQAIRKTYSLKSMSDFKAKVLENLFNGLHLDIDGEEVWCKLVGLFNAYNLLAIYSVAVLLGHDKHEVLRILSDLGPAEGRFEYIFSADGRIAVVDYAHTPDALLNVLVTINQIRSHNEKLFTVFGAGGDRDRTKRPEMGKIAAEISDKVIITSDNPRSEDPAAIIEEIMTGIDPWNRKKVITIMSRRDAIHTACIMAEPGDIILLAGKGHEKYQEIKGVKHHFDDKEEVMKYFNEDINP